MFVHFEPVNHKQRNPSAQEDSPGPRKLRKASDAVVQDHRDQHGYHTPPQRGAAAVPRGRPHGKKPGSAAQDGIVQRSLGMFSKIKDYLLTKDKEDLSSSGANGEASGGDGLRSILHEIAAAGDLPTMQKLLKNKAAAELKLLIDAQDSNGWQPLHEAVRGKDL